jgi:hypothetical protein
VVRHCWQEKTLSWLLFFGFAQGCQSYPFVYRPNQRVAGTTVDEISLRAADTDVLFVIDNSGSMEEEQNNVIRNTAVFINELSQSDNAYRVGIITTDALDQGHPGLDGGRLRMHRATQAALNAASCGITPDTSAEPYLDRPDPADTQVEAKRCRLVEDFKATVASLGTGGSGTECGLAAAKMALDPNNSVTRTANAGFLRADADLAVIYMSDEEDCSFDSYASSGYQIECYANKDQAIPPESFVTFFANLKGPTAGVRKVRGALIAGGIMGGEGNSNFEPMGCYLTSSGPTADCGCWSSINDNFYCTYLNGFGQPCASTGGCSGSTCPSASNHTCDTPRCQALPAARYDAALRSLRMQRLAVGFSAGIYEDSICQNEYDKTLLAIARNVVLSDCFSLDQPPIDPNAISLAIRQTNGTTGAVTDTPIMHLDPDPSNTSADCHDCGGCSAGAWQLMDSETICLQCGLKKHTGDEYVLHVLNEVIGF